MLTTRNGPLLSAEELPRSDVPGRRTELVRGRLVVRDLVGTRHAMVTATLARIIGTWLQDHPAGVVPAGDPGLVLQRGTDTVLGPH